MTDRIVIFPRGQLTELDKARFVEAGILVAEADDPTAVVQTECKAQLHGYSSECPSLPNRAPFTTATAAPTQEPRAWAVVTNMGDSPGFMPCPDEASANKCAEAFNGTVIRLYTHPAPDHAALLRRVYEAIGEAHDLSLDGDSMMCREFLLTIRFDIDAALKGTTP